MIPRHARGGGGFTLIEFLLVVGMLGLVMAAIYSTYLANQKTSVSQGEVVEVQQNLRVALDCLTRDLKMAGVLVPAGTTPIAAASGTPSFPTYSTNIMLNTASAEGRMARVDQAQTLSAVATLELRIEPPGNRQALNSVDGFAAGDLLRLIRPLDGSQPLSGTRTLVISNIPNNPFRGYSTTLPPTITVAKSDASEFSSGDIVQASDILAKVADTATYPMTVAYFLVPGGTVVRGFTCPQAQMCLVRRVNGNSDLSDIVATNLQSLRFSYLDAFYHEAAVPSDLPSVRAVRITLRGVTARTAAAAGARVRSVTTVVKLRNRR